MKVEAVAGTANWLAARRGVLTASVMRDAAAMLRDGKTPSVARKNLMMNLAAEILTGVATDHIVTKPMRWGIEQEPNAIAAYEAITGEIVGPQVFVLHPKIENFGATPDALVGLNGLLECKCPNTNTHINWWTGKGVPEEHRLQMATQIACTGREWCDFLSFDPRLPKRQQVILRRYIPTPAEIAEVEAVARKFNNELFALVARVNESNFED